MFDPRTYGGEIESVLTAHGGGGRLMPLAPSGPLWGKGLKRLRRISNAELFGEQAIEAEDFADCVRSALFLYFSDLQHSHTISQNIPTATGSFLHGVMHRQEPDFSNSKYWFRRVGNHEVFPQLREDVLAMLSGTQDQDPAAGELRSQVDSLANWDPFWFVDQCEAARQGEGRLETSLERIQLVEWQLLFDYCYRKAIGGD